jgi:hypothetical protein
VSCYEGDWFDACRIYREWALNQSWTKQGSLHQRTDTPKWFKEIDMWMPWGTIIRAHNAPYAPETKKRLDGLSKGLLLHYWGKGQFLSKMSPSRFPLNELDRSTIRLAKENNYPIMGFIQTLCWDLETKSFKELKGIDHTVKNLYGQPIVWDLRRPESTGHQSAIAYPGKLWTEVLGATILKMAQEAEFDAAYMDSFNHAGTYMNFNPVYCTESGGGNTYIKDNQKMLREIKERVRNINPEFCFTGESFWEGNMSELDGYYSCNTTSRLLRKREILAVPMAQAVYHDYAIFFGAWSSRHDLETDNGLSYIAKSGQAFVWGIKSGWVQPALLIWYKNAPIALDAVAKRGHAYAAARKFLVYGQMLREPKFLNQIPSMDVKWYIEWSKKYHKISMPTVLCSLWYAPDGTLGLILYNIGSKDQKVSVELSNPSYAVNKASRGRIISLYPVKSQTNEWRSFDEPKIVVSCNVSARTPMVFEIELEK